MTRHAAIVEFQPVLGASDPAELAEPIAPASLLRLLQFTSPALPIGAFAFSQGLETAVELRFIHDEASAQAWLLGTLEAGLERLDLPVLSRLCGAFRNGDETGADVWSTFLLASRESAERREEDRQLGRALARLLSDQGLVGAGAWLERENVTHASLFALASVHFDVPGRTALMGFAFSWAENQVSALSRLVPLGQLAAQRVLAAVGAAIPGSATRAGALPDAALGATLPGLALASALHETQYTRLFKS